MGIGKAFDKISGVLGMGNAKDELDDVGVITGIKIDETKASNEEAPKRQPRKKTHGIDDNEIKFKHGVNTAVDNNVVHLRPGNTTANVNIATRSMKVMVVEPVSFDDAQHVADHIRNRKPVVVNFENTDTDIAKRIIDFISGTTYALAGNIRKVGNNIFLCAPSNVDVTFAQQTENADKVVMPWMKK